MSASALLISLPAKAGLHLHGKSGGSQGVGRSVINAGSSSIAFLNLTKGFAQNCTTANFPSLLNADGYPVGPTLANEINGGVGVTDPNYYGRYLVWWSGTGCLQFDPQTIVYSGGAAVTGVSPSASGAVPFNLTMGLTGNPTQAAPVEFAFGALISAVGTNAGLVQFTSPTANAFANITTGAWYKFFNGINGLGVGPNPDGSWVVTVNDSTHITLQASSAYAGLVTITGAGGPGTQTEAILSVPGSSWKFLTAGTYSSFANLMWCQKANQAAAIAGQLVSPDYVNTFKALNPRFIRFMDFSAVQGDRSSSYTYRSKPSHLSWSVMNYNVDYYAGTITNGGSDNYTCSNPTASGVGAYAEGEVVAGQLGSSSVNTTILPTLNVNSRGPKPIFNSLGSQLSAFFAGTVPATATTVTFVFTGGGLSAPFSYKYQPNANATNAFTGSCAAGVLTVNSVSAGAVTIGQIIQGAGIPSPTQIKSQLGGTPNGAGTYSISQTGFSTGAGITITGVTPLFAQNGSSRPDVDFTSLSINIRADMQGVIPNGNGSTLFAANIVALGQVPAGSLITFCYNPNINSSGVAALNNGLTISGSDSAGSGTYTFGYVGIGDMPNSTYWAFTYSKLLGGWVTTTGASGPSASDGGGLHGGPPIEFYIDFCTRANVGMYLTLGQMWSDDRIYNTVLQIANAGVKELVLEVSNETWNFFLQESRISQNLGAALGVNALNFAGANYNSVDAYPALKTIQMAQQAAAAWAAAGRTRSQLFVTIAYQFVNMSALGTTTTSVYKFNGAALNASGTGTNVTLKAYGGYGATAITTDFSASPNRPIDFADCVSPAPYWLGGQYNSGGGQHIDTGVPLAAYNGSLLAAYNYVNGNPTQQAAALDFLYNGTSGDLYNGTLNGSPWQAAQFSLGGFAVGSGISNVDSYCGVGTVIAAYDATRIANGRPILGMVCYEGGWQLGPNSIGASNTDQSGIAADLTSLGYTSGYTSSLPGAAAGPTSTATSDALNLITLLNAFRRDTRANLLYARYLTECRAAGVVGGARLSLPCQYGFEGNGFNLASYWSIYQGNISSTPYQAWNALQAFDN